MNSSVIYIIKLMNFVFFKQCISKYFIFLPILVFSILFTYNYASFEDNASIGVGYTYTAKSIALEYNYNVNEYLTASGVDVININDNYYLPYAPLPSFLFAASYFFLQIFYYFYINFISTINGEISYIFESIFLKLPVAFAHFFTAILIYKFLKKLEVTDYFSIISAYSYALGTSMFNYSLSTYKHNISTFAITAAIYFIYKSQFTEKKFSNLIIAGTFIGIGFLSELPVIMITIAYFIYQLMIYLSKKDKDFLQVIKNCIAIGTPVALSIVSLLTFQYFVYGNPYLSGDQIFQQQQIEMGKTSFSFTRNIIEGLYGLFLSPLKGLVWVSPFLLFGFFGWYKFFKNITYRKFAIFIGIYFSYIICLYATWSDCFGATPFGVRHISTVIPLLVIFKGYYISSANILLQRLYILLLGFSIFVVMSVAMSGLPSGLYIECNINKFGSYSQAFSIYKNNDFAPVIIKFLITGKSF